MKSKLIAVYFSATMSVFNINAMNLEELAAKQSTVFKKIFKRGFYDHRNTAFLS